MAYARHPAKGQQCEFATRVSWSTKVLVLAMTSKCAAWRWDTLPTASRSFFLIDGLATKTAFGVQIRLAEKLIADNDGPTDGGLREVDITSDGGGHVIRAMAIPPGGHRRCTELYGSTTD